jgi:ribosome-binding factor A|tara:strand:+ start:601 stop:972 length:372 start_codon:yes stop_codon:yes gene_type:complete
MADFQRTERIGDLIQRELALYIQRELSDPRLKMVTVSGVDVSRDLAHAKVYVSTLVDDDVKGAEIITVLEKASGLLRHMLGKNIKLRTLPKLHFVLDRTSVEGPRMSRLIDDAIRDDESPLKD